MNARVKQDYRWNAVTAFSGFEFVKGEYRLVPAGAEAEAVAHDALEIEVEKAPAEDVVFMEEPEAVKLPAKKVGKK